MLKENEPNCNTWSNMNEINLVRRFVKEHLDLNKVKLLMYVANNYVLLMPK